MAACIYIYFFYIYTHTVLLHNVVIRVEILVGIYLIIFCLFFIKVKGESVANQCDLLKSSTFSWATRLWLLCREGHGRGLVPRWRIVIGAHLCHMSVSSHTSAMPSPSAFSLWFSKRVQTNDNKRGGGGITCNQRSRRRRGRRT
jgi:hypothetical protein